MPKPRSSPETRNAITVVVSTVPCDDIDARRRKIVQILLAAVARRSRGEAA